MRRRQQSTASISLRLPAIAACFLIRFDKRVGYTLSWSRAIPGLELEGAVEYKSLPSGLHNVQQDLVYFTHSGNAGLSAFVQQPASEAERNVRFVAVGVLVPLNYGRFGRGWLHAEYLQDLARELLGDIDNTQPLEDYWRKHGLATNDADPLKDGQAALSESLTLASSSSDLSPFHPILSMTSFLDEFGPLIFPLYRTALLRQRILFHKEPPLRLPCEYVYILSVITTIPSILANELPDPSMSRITPIFTLCIHDIPRLEEAARRGRYSDNDPQASAILEDDLDKSWIACTSDGVLLTKPNLSDTRVKIPPRSNASTQEKQWPSIQSGWTTYTKATQRDLRRYKALRQVLSHFEQRSSQDGNDPDRPLPTGQTSVILSRAEAQAVPVEVPTEGAVVEPPSWAAVVYDSYLWWASAGERSADLQQEYERDADLLFAAADVWDDAEAYARRESMINNPIGKLKASGALEMAVVAYFHRMTATIFECLGRLLEAADLEAESRGAEASAGAKLFVLQEDLSAMGLDPWSQNDRDWVALMVRTYFGREAEVQGASIECCGIKLY